MEKEKELPQNIPCSDFKEAQEKGIINREPTFELNKIKYYTFCKELSMISANRYLLYQQDLQSYQSFHMSTNTSRDYVEEMIEHQLAIEKAIRQEDWDLVRKAYEDLKLTTLVYKSHQHNFNVISAILELNAIAFISASENPFVVDYDIYNKKILDWGLALASGESDEFLRFFWKLSSHGDQNWIDLLVRSMRHLALKEEEMTEEQRNRKILDENILIIEISKASRLLQDLIANKTSKNPQRSLRAISNLIKHKLNSSAYQNIFHTQSSQAN